MTFISIRSFAVGAALGIGIAATAPADEPAMPKIIDCKADAVAPWLSAGEGYRAQASTQGSTCVEASLDLALVAPSGRAVWEQHFSNVAAIRPLYGVPDGKAMLVELQTWITQTDDPARSDNLPAWPSDAATPYGFEPETSLSRDAYEDLRKAAKPLFCYAEPPGFDSCVALMDAYDVKPIGRRPTQ